MKGEATMTYSSQLRYQKQKVSQWLSCKNLPEVAALLELPYNHLQLLLLQPSYHIFEIPKADKTFRTIEAPLGQVKTVLQKLNTYLQACYYFCKTPAAYGYVSCLQNDPDPRNIVLNASRHLNKKYLLNIDLDNFFHQVTTAKVADIFYAKPFKIHKYLMDWLCGITTYNGRLPMGSPTSPVLSNFATIALDNELQAFAVRNNITYTRYVDDLSFSCSTELNQKHFQEIQDIIQSHQFLLNYDKVKWFKPEDDKIITGLIVNKKVEIPHSFLENLEADILRLKHSLEVHQAFQPNSKTNWLEEFELQVTGKINFISMVYGTKSQTVQYFNNKLNDAYKTADYLQSRNWLDFNYQW